MWLYFNKQRTLVEQINHGDEPARVGSIGSFKIFAFFEEVDLTEYTTATIRLQKPDLNSTVYPEFSGSVTTRHFDVSESPENLNYFKNDTDYTGFVFNFNIFGLLDMPGMWKATISLYKANDPTRSVSGEVRFNVQEAVYDEDDITMSAEIYNEILETLATKMNVKESKVIRWLDDISEDIEYLDSAVYSDGDLIFDKESKDICILHYDGEEDVFTYSLFVAIGSSSGGGGGEAAVRDIEVSYDNTSDILTATLKERHGGVISSDTTTIPLSEKQNVLTFDSTPTQDSLNPVTSGGVYSECKNIREVAEGKCKAYVIATQSQITGTKDANDEYTGVTAISGITLTDLNVGDIIYITELDVPDYWVSALVMSGDTLQSVSLNKMETSKVDLSNYVTLNSDQTITGQKTIQILKLHNDSSNYTYQIQAQSNNNFRIVTSETNGILMTPVKEFAPVQTETHNLGISYLKWKDLYLSGKIKDGTNEFNADNVFNVINASDIASGNVLTDEQISVITNGRITLVNGTLLSMDNLVLFGTKESSDRYEGMYISYQHIGRFRITKSSKVIAAEGSGTQLIQLKNLAYLNGKYFPVYPTTNTSRQFLSIAANGGALSWESGTTSVNWGLIGGTLADQTDLQNALNGKTTLYKHYVRIGQYETYTFIDSNPTAVQTMYDIWRRTGGAINIGEFCLGWALVASTEVRKYYYETGISQGTAGITYKAYNVSDTVTDTVTQL